MSCADSFIPIQSEQAIVQEERQGRSKNRQRAAQKYLGAMYLTFYLQEPREQQEGYLSLTQQRACGARSPLATHLAKTGTKLGPRETP